MAPENIPPILIVTATKVELKAVLNTFAPQATWKRHFSKKKTYYTLGLHGGVPVQAVQQSMMGSGTPGGALLTVRQAIADLRPLAVIMCGVAFGCRPQKQALGHILIAERLQSYEPEKRDQARGPISRGDRVVVSELLLDRFRAGDVDWQGAETHFGLILSGEKLVNDPVFLASLLEAEPEAIGGEMEGAGLYAAARDEKVDWILVKAICDWGNGDKHDDAQPEAARNAAEFVKHVVEMGGWEAETPPAPGPAPDVKSEPGAADSQSSGPDSKPAVAASPPEPQPPGQPRSGTGGDVAGRDQTTTTIKVGDIAHSTGVAIGSGSQTVVSVTVNNLPAEPDQGQKHEAPAGPPEPKPASKPTPPRKRLKPVEFVNRSNEIRELTATTTSGQCFLVHAPAGYGKTELLKEVQKRFLNDLEWECGRAVLTKAGTLKEAARQLAESLGVAEGLDNDQGLSWGSCLGGALHREYLQAPPLGRGLALLIDLEGEPSLKLLRALLREFIPEVLGSLLALTAFSGNQCRIRIIVAARYLADASVVGNTRLSFPAIPYPLSPFTYEVVLQSTQRYLNAVNSSQVSDLAAHILHLTGGHPGGMAYALQLFSEKGVSLETFLDKFVHLIHKRIGAVAEAITKNLDRKYPHVRPIITETLSVLRYVDIYALADIVASQPVSGVRDYHDLRDQLISTSLFSQQAGLYADSITRQVLAGRLRYGVQNGEVRFANRCRWACELCARRVINAPVAGAAPPPWNADKWAIEHLFQCLQASGVKLRELRARQTLSRQFFEEAVPDTLRLYLDGRSILPEHREAEIGRLLDAMTEPTQWEFRFAVNFYLGEATFTEAPYAKLRETIADYKGSSVKEGDHHG
jgi:nucleoside phosphorylase